MGSPIKQLSAWPAASLPSTTFEDSLPQRGAINWSLLAGLRFVLATIVFFTHALWFERGTFAVAVASLGAKAAVVGFLLVSGFSIAASITRDEGRFYFRRFKRIYPLYFLSVLAAIALEIWLGQYQIPHFKFEPTGTVAAIGNLFLVQTFLVKTVAYNPVLWSLAVEVSFYIISPILRRLPLAVIAGTVAVSAIFYLMPHHTDWGLIYIYLLKANAVKYFWPFAIGFALYFNRSPHFLAAPSSSERSWSGARILILNRLRYSRSFFPCL